MQTQMSASTVSITANQGPTTRRRAIEKNISAGGSDVAITAENLDARLTAVDTAATILRDARKTSIQTQMKKSGVSRKPAKPLWLTVISILTKNLALLVVLLGFVQMIRWAVWNSGSDAGDFSVISGDIEGKLSEIEKFTKTTIKAMQVQVDAIDQKSEYDISSVRKEFDEKLKERIEDVGLKLKALDARGDAFEKFIDGFGTKSLLSKEEFAEFFEEFQNSRGGSDDVGEVTVDEIKSYAREIVEKEIEKHAADGLGMVDYALASGGGKVLRHSEPFGARKLGVSGVWLVNRNGVNPESEKMIRPSFGEPGHCFPLKGGSGFVVVRLRTSIVPEAVTLEHVAKSVAYDRSSAPKDCTVSGWLQGKDSNDLESGAKIMSPLAEFTYDLEKTNVQTYKVKPTASNPVDTIRLDFTSNHGSASHTCIYRLRVHGYEPNSVAALKMQS